MKQSLKLTTSKMPKETESQYTAFLLYCEVGSLRKLHEVWDRLGQISDNISTEFVAQLGKKPAWTTLGNWSKKYQWVVRADLKLSEDVEVLKKKTSQIRQKRLHIITDVFWDKLHTLKKQMRSGESATVPEVKALWEMMRIEGGESISKQEIVQGINEDEQRPLTPEEEELSKALTELEKEFSRKQLEKNDDTT
jgi:hypothetical protein